MIINIKQIAALLSVFQVKEFKYLEVLFTSDGKMEREIERIYRTVVGRIELVYLCSNPHMIMSFG